MSNAPAESAAAPDGETPDQQLVATAPGFEDLLLSLYALAALYALDGDPAAVLEGAVQIVARVCQCACAVMVRGPRAATARFVAGDAGSEHAALLAGTDGSPALQAMQSEQPIRLANGPAPAWVAVPMRSGGVVVGALVAVGSGATSAPISFLEAVAGFIALPAARIGAELEGVPRREQAEAERARLQAVLHQLPEGVLLFDAGERLEMSNQSVEQILGQPVDPSTPSAGFATRYGFVRGDGRPYLHGDDPIARTFSTGVPALGEEVTVRRADGRDIPVVSNVAPVRDASGRLTAVIMVFQDITSLREMDRLKDDFLSIAGHELRTPITTVRGLAQLVGRRRDRLDAGTIDGALSTIVEQTEQMSRLVDELLDVSRIRTGRLSLQSAPLDLAPVLEAAVRRARSQRGGPVELTIQGKLPVEGDRDRLDQVFVNLLDNASKYSEAGSAISVTARRSEREVIVSVADRGVGVPPESLERLFERFYRAENAVHHASGLGLGLYLCREIVERHGGRIAVESTRGEGTTFTVRLPVRREDERDESA